MTLGNVARDTTACASIAQLAEKIMRLMKMAQMVTFRSSLCEDDGNQDRYKVCQHKASNDHGGDKDHESPSETIKQHEGDEIESVKHERYGSAGKSRPLTIKDQMMMFDVQ